MFSICTTSTTNVQSRGLFPAHIEPDAYMDRPVTSKPRGICRYYNTTRGCYAGDDCKFLHGADEKLTPYDKAKVCRYYVKGHCTRGERCWFRHALPILPPGDERAVFDSETCSICLEKPVAYGLLTDCSHVFCLQCIRRWRDPGGKSSDVISSGAIKCCPLCRATSRFVTPSTHFFPQGNPQKKVVIDAYKASMARVPCRYFEATSRTGKPCCPFGTDCFYQHLNPDGTPHIFRHGAKQAMITYRRHQRDAGFTRPRSNYLDPIQFLQHIFENPITNLHATLDVIRASLPALMERFEMNGDSSIDAENPLSPREDDDESEGLPEHENDEPLLSTENVAVELSVIDAAGGSHVSIDTSDVTENRDGDHASSASPESVGIRPSSASFVISTSERDILVPTRPLSSAETRDGRDDIFLPLASASTLASPGPSEPSIGNPTSRFSTIIPSRSREALIIDISDDEDEDTRESLAAHPSGTGLAHVKSLDARPADGPVSASSVPVTRPPTPTEDIPDMPSSSSSYFADTISRQHQCEHESDPPFVTDGRGRVVWSSTRNTSGRGSGSRRSRTGSAARPGVGRGHPPPRVL